MRISDWSSDVCSSDLHGRHDQRVEVADMVGHHDQRPHRWRTAQALALHAEQQAHEQPVYGKERDRQQPVTEVPWLDPAPISLGDDLALRGRAPVCPFGRSEEHTSELQSLMRISYAVFCLKKKNNNK